MSFKRSHQNMVRGRSAQALRRAVRAGVVDALESRVLMAASDVTINEIMYNSASFETADEYVELYNKGPTAVSLNGWKLASGVDYTFGSQSIAAGQYLVVTADLARFAQKYPGVSNVVGPWTGQLSNSSNTIRLVNGSGNEIDSVTYADDGDWAVRRRGGQDPKKVTEITRSGSNATVALPNHGYATGQGVAIFGANQAAYDGIFTISGTASGSFTIGVSGSPVTPATGQIYVRRADQNHFGWDWFNLADGGGKSMELINAALPNQHGQNWAPSVPDNGTPGAVNSVASTNLAPMILGMSHFPIVPTSSQEVTVRAELKDELASGLSAKVFYRDDKASSWSEAPMFDDGAHGDGSAGDGVYAAQLPPRPNNTVVEFYVQATDSTGKSRTWPGPTDVTGVQQANALYQVDDTQHAFTPGGQPVFKIIVTDAELDELDRIEDSFPEANSNAQMNATWVSIDGDGTDLRYVTGVRNRGGGSRVATVNNYRVNFGSADPWHGVQSVNFNAQSSASEVAASALLSRAGVLAQNVTAAQVRVNNANLARADLGMFGSYSWTETEDNDFVENHFPNDDQGNYYRVVDGTHDSHLAYKGTNGASYASTYLKQTNVEENNFSDLINLTFSFSTNVSNANFASTISQVIDVPQWMRHFAMSVLLGNNETTLATGRGDDYGLYRGVTDPRFKIVAHDLDTILTLGDSQSSINQTIFRPALGVSSMPIEGTSVRRLLQNPSLVPVYYAQLKDLAETVFTRAELSKVLYHALGNYVPRAQIESAIDNGVKRAAAVLGQIPQDLDVTTAPAVTDGYPKVTAADLNAAVLAGRAPAIDTRSVKVNGASAVWSPYGATWSFTNSANVAALKPGVNRVLVQAFDGSNVEIDRSYVDVWYDDASVGTKTGAIAANTTWTAGGGPYLVTGNVTVNAGATLIIEAGTTVYFAPNTKLIVNGRLEVNGTQNNRVKFRRDLAAGTNTAWAGVQFNNSGGANRMTYADIEQASSASAVIDINASRVDLIGIAFPNNVKTSALIDVSGASSFRLQDSVIPDLVNVEPLHGAGAAPATGYVIIQGNTFGTTTGHQDIIDWTGGKRGGPILQIVNNVFTGTGTGFTEADDILDLDGTDAHIEGNVFMNVYPSSTPDTNSAISGGRDPTTSNTSHIVSVRNVFYNVDHAFLMKEGNYVASVNDTFTKVLTGVFNFAEPGFAPTPGLGGYADGAIFYDVPTNNGRPVIVQNPPTGSFAVRNSILPAAWPGAVNSVVADPQFVNPNNVTDPRRDLAIKGTSPARGRGPNGRDAGFTVPGGASISGEPLSPSLRNSATLTVGGPDVWAYKYKVNSGAWSAEIPVTNPGLANAVVPAIQLTNLANGAYTVYVARKNSAGVWQPDAEATASKTWTVATANSGRIRINEVLADNQSAHANGGHYLDVIELFNDGTAAIDLSDYSITDNPNSPRKFIFPAGTSLGAGQYMRLYADDAQAGATGTFLGFSLRQAGEGVYLYNKLSAGGAIADSVVFGVQLRDRSIGRIGDGGAWGLTQPTIGAANVALPTGDPHKLRINEWQAGAAEPFNDDYVELYNPGALPTGLGGLSISDKASDWPTKHVFTPLSFIDAGGYLALLADEDTAAGADHLNFKLAKDRGKLGLYDSQQNLIDFLFYNNQADGVSEGLLPDGSNRYVFFPDQDRSPGLANTTPANFKNILTLIDPEGVWRFDQSSAFDNTAANPWFGNNFVDSGWATGRAVLFNDSETIAGNKNTQLNLGRTAYYFRRHFNLDADPSTIDRLLVTAIVDDGAVLYLNGQEAYRLAMPTNVATIAYNTLATTNIDNAGYSFFVLPKDALRFGDNILAVEVHQSATNSSDIAFGLQLEAEQTIINPPPPPLRITEINYNSPGAGGVTGDETEFIELMNIGSQSLNLTDYEFRGGVVFDFPDNYTLAPGARTVVVKNLSAFRARYGNTIPVAGQYTDSLDNGGEVVRLVSNLGVVIHDFIYSDQWHPSTDGAGDTLVINNPHQDLALWGEAAGWSASSAILGTPGTIEEGLAKGSLVVSEVLAGSEGGARDWVELRNTTGAPIDVSGWYLSDTDGNLLKYRVPAGTVVPAFGYFVFDEAQHFGNVLNGANAFSLSSSGDDIYLSSSDAAGVLGGYREGVSFGASAQGVPMGRYQTSTGRIDFVALSRATRGGDNAAPLVGPVVFNEVMYNPTSGRDEYIELKNISSSTVQLFDPANSANTWRFTSGVGFDFPTGLSLGAGQSLLVVGIDPAAFRTKYNIPAGVQIIGPWTGNLDNDGGRIELVRPGTPVPGSGEVPWIRVDSLAYDDDTPWPGAADGTGASLGRFVESHYGDDVANWRAETPLGSPGAANVVSPVTAAGELLQLTPHKLVFRFSKNVSASLQKEDLVLQNLTAGSVPSTAMAMTYDAASNTATWTFPGLAGGMLPVGRFRATLSAASINAPGGNLDGNGDGTPGDNYVYDFHHLPGDLDGDGAVTFTDFQTLERNFGRTGATWEMGDLTADGRVDSADFTKLYANFGTVLAAAPPVPASPVAAPAPEPLPVVQAPAPARPAPVKKPAAAKKAVSLAREIATPAATFSSARITKKRADTVLT